MTESTDMAEQGDEGSAPLPARRAGRPTNARHTVKRVRAETVRAEARPQTGRLQRKRRRTENPYDVPRELIPEGMSWEWKSESILGQRKDDHMAHLKDNHWRPVDQEKYPNLVCKKDGMVLMERPKYLTQDARREDLDIALERVQSVAQNVTETPSGQMTRAHPSVRANSRVHRDYNVAIAGDEPSYSDPT